LQLYAVSNTTWSETGLTWNNKPAAGTALGGVKTITTTTGQWYEWDVTSYLQQQRLAGATGVSFALKAPNTSDPWAIFNSGESALNAPELVVNHTV
ncbi:MAG: DNRLRE domain-containing protein, partial [Planctomycetota bacterium]|nr:DNRLRE domain-containing protein [Planctomycetota bacterium]